MAYLESYKLGCGVKKYRTVWRTPEGKKQSRSFDRKRDAQTFKVEIERRTQLGDLFTERPLSFGEFVGLKWTNEKGVHVDGDSPSSWIARYQPTVRAGSFKRRSETFRYLAEFLPLTFDRVTPAVVEDAVARMATEHPRQAQYLLQTIKMVLRAAALRGQPIREAVLRISPPTYEPRRKRFLTMEQVGQLADGSEHPRLIRFAALTGLRFVELAGITDEDVALGDRAVMIHRGITKTDAGVRRVPLGAEARGILLEQRLARPAGATHLFPAPRGGPMRYENFYHRLWIPTRDAFGMADLDFHDLRHSYASLMIAAGIHPRILKDLMGHESVTVTMDTYGHLYEGAADAAVETLDAFLTTQAGRTPQSLPHECPITATSN